MDDQQNEPPAWFLKSIARSRADAAAGRVVSSDGVMHRISEAVKSLKRTELAKNEDSRHET